MSRASDDSPSDPSASLNLLHGKARISKELNPLSATGGRLRSQCSKTIGPKQFRCELEGFRVIESRVHDGNVAGVLFGRTKLFEMLRPADGIENRNSVDHRRAQREILAIAAPLMGRCKANTTFVRVVMHLPDRTQQLSISSDADAMEPTVEQSSPAEMSTVKSAGIGCRHGVHELRETRVIVR